MEGKKLIVLVLALLAVGVIAFIRFHEPRTPRIDFATLRLAATPNQYLVCPAALCAQAAAHATAPVYAVRPAQLSRAFQRLLQTQPRILLVRQSPDRLAMTLIQRSALMAYPDIIDVVFVAAEGGASVAIYSRSVYGISDLGVNEKRVRAWLAGLAERIE